MSLALARGAFTPQKQFIYIFTLTIVIQAFHMAEHLAQVMQKFVLHIVPAHGLIGALDLEQVHFAFNLLYLTTLIVVMTGWLYYGGQLCPQQKKLAALLIGTVVVQSYHMAEHTVKLIQFFETMTQGTPGILGVHFDPVVFHALMNTAVFVPVVAVFFCAGLHRELFRRPPGQIPQAQS